MYTYFKAARTAFARLFVGTILTARIHVYTLHTSSRWCVYIYTRGIYFARRKCHSRASECRPLPRRLTSVLYTSARLYRPGRHRRRRRRCATLGCLAKIFGLANIWGLSTTTTTTHSPRASRHTPSAPRSLAPYVSLIKRPTLSPGFPAYIIHTESELHTDTQKSRERA